MSENVKIVDAVFECDGDKTPFGRRWGGQVVRLDKAQMEALKEGKILAIDVNSEYVVFVEGVGDE